MKNEYDFSKAKKAAKAKEVKVIKTFRLDPEILQWLEEEGEKNGMGYQTFLNWHLHKAMQDHHSLEERVEKLEAAVLKKRA